MSKSNLAQHQHCISHNFVYRKRRIIDQSEETVLLNLLTLSKQKIPCLAALRRICRHTLQKNCHSGHHNNKTSTVQTPRKSHPSDVSQNLLSDISHLFAGSTRLAEFYTVFCSTYLPAGEALSQFPAPQSTRRIAGLMYHHHLSHFHSAEKFQVFSGMRETSSRSHH